MTDEDGPGSLGFIVAGAVAAAVAGLELVRAARVAGAFVAVFLAMYPESPVPADKPATEHEGHGARRPNQPTGGSARATKLEGE